MSGINDNMIENGIPKKITEVTCEYLTKVFKENGYLKNGQIESINFDKDKVGRNSDSAHFELIYSNNSTGVKPVKVFVKLNKDGLGEEETKFYLYLKKNNIELDIFVKCYFVDYDKIEKRAILILKDYREFHVPPYDLDPARNVPDDDPYFEMLETVAELHAYWWEDETIFDHFYTSHYDKHKLEKEFHKDPDISIFYDYEVLWGKFYKNEKNWISQECKDMFIGALKNYREVWERYRVKKINEKKHFTITNGDCYWQQFLCLSKESKEKTKMIDMSAEIGNPTRDLVFMIVKHLNPAQRNFKNREQRLLKHYHKSLVKFGVKNYSFDELYEDYRVEIFFLIFFALFDYSYQGPVDNYWWNKFNVVNHAYMDLKCDELYKDNE